MPNFVIGSVGGGGGGAFDDTPFNTIGAAQRPIQSIQVSSGVTIDHLIVTYSGEPFSPQHGTSNGGTAHPAFVLNRGEHLVRVTGSVGTFHGTTVQIMGLQFATSAGRVSPLFGTKTGIGFAFDAPPGGSIAAFFGRSGLFIDQLGFWGNP